MSFTTGGLFLQESVIMATLYQQLKNWDAVRSQAIEQNLLQSRTTSTAKRISREIAFRLAKLGPGELEFLIEADSQEQGYLLWIAVCRHYQFVAEFATEVLRERFVTLKADLHHVDFDAFFNEKAGSTPALEKISTSTRKKLRQVLFRMLREADLLSSDFMIKAALLSPRLSNLISRGDPAELSYFPIVADNAMGVSA